MSLAQSYSKPSEQPGILPRTAGVVASSLRAQVSSVVVHPHGCCTFKCLLLHRAACDGSTYASLNGIGLAGCVLRLCVHVLRCLVECASLNARCLLAQQLCLLPQHCIVARRVGADVIVGCTVQTSFYLLCQMGMRTLVGRVFNHGLRASLTGIATSATAMGMMQENKLA